jgi:hypothetical protein
VASIFRRIPFGLRLRPVQVIHGLLRVRGGLDDAALVVFEGFEPVGDIAGMVITYFWRQLQIGAQDSLQSSSGLS